MKLFAKSQVRGVAPDLGWGHTGVMESGIRPANALDFNNLLPKGETLFDYQHLGIAYALLTRRCFIADEQGLGKTRQALVACKAAGIRQRIIVVCKASLKGNWARECERILPEYSVEIVSGRQPYQPSGDIVIVNYDILADWEPCFVNPEALILDESHYCKESKTKRTKAALALSARVPAEGLVLLLTGTPILNRPVELASQLRIMGRIRDIAPRPYRRSDEDVSWEFSFKHRYCGAEHNGYGWTYNGSSNLAELNEKMRRICFVRRMRNEVLGMNETRRYEVPLSLNGSLDKYRRAEDDFMRFLMAEEGTKAVEKAKRAEVLVRLNVLRQLAGMAKVEAATEWINDWLEENPERKLVVFAWHIEVQEAIAKATGGIYLRGAKDIEAAKAEFNQGEARVIVCSLQAHREGHTLVGNGNNVQDVLFIENPWNAGSKSQAEDRINRIGQNAEQVFAWTFLAQGADIDTWLSELVEAKRAVAKQAIDGTLMDDESEDEQIQDEIIRRFREKGQGR